MPAETPKKPCSHTLHPKGQSYPRNCAGKVTYTAPDGRTFCKRHEPDAERKALWAAIHTVQVAR